MKALKFNILFCVLFIGACTRVPLDSFYSRSDTFNRDYNRGEKSQSGDVETPSPPIVHDTTLYYSLVKFDNNYDWRKDTSFLYANYTVEFYKNEELVLSLSPSKSLSPDPDTHFVIDGSFFTQNSNNTNTYLSRDGEEILSFKGRELIRGIIIVGNDIYTLSSSRSGKGFSYRLNGEVVLAHNDGYVLGDLSDLSYSDTGAIYFDEGKICFCYYIENDGKYRYFSVIDGTEREINIKTKVDDIKLINGEVVNTQSKYTIEEARVWRRKEGVIVSGYYKSQFSGVSSSSSVPIQLCSEKAQVIPGYNKLFGVLSTEDNSVVIYEGGLGSEAYNNKEGDKLLILEPSSESYSNSLLLSQTCICVCEDTLIVALCSSLSPSQHKIKVDDRIISLNFNGYVSGVSMSINPPN